ncbi:MAG: hypothetical protein Q7J05_04810 [Paludibacter sp.]|nr:hypothetical protein [Paludibacter sp.]
MNCIIDKLSLCYRIENIKPLADYLLNNDDEAIKEIVFDGGSFSMYLSKSKGFKSAYSITYYDLDEKKGINSDGKYEMKKYIFGTLKFGQLDDDETLKAISLDDKKVWIDIENSSFYFRSNSQTNKLVYLDYITDELGLRFNNVTHIDIAIDSDKFNFAKIVKSLLRCNELTPIVVNKTYEDKNELIPHVLFIYATSCTKLLSDFSIYIQQKGNDSITAKCYNKRYEIENKSEKDYISEYYDYPKKLNRFEIRLHRKQFQKYIETKKVEFDTALFWDESNDFLFDMFIHYIYVLIRFRKSKYDKNPMNVFEALEWLEKRKKEIRTQKRKEKLKKSL